MAINNGRLYGLYERGSNVTIISNGLARVLGLKNSLLQYYIYVNHGLPGEVLGKTRSDHFVISLFILQGGGNSSHGV